MEIGDRVVVRNIIDPDVRAFIGQIGVVEQIYPQYDYPVWVRYEDGDHESFTEAELEVVEPGYEEEPEEPVVTGRRITVEMELMSGIPKTASTVAFQEVAETRKGQHKYICPRLVLPRLEWKNELGMVERLIVTIDEDLREPGNTHSE